MPTPLDPPPKKPAPSRPYAEGTSVTVERTRAELDALLERHCATSIGILRDAHGATLVFEIGGFRIKQLVRTPDPASFQPVAPKAKNQHTKGRTAEEAIEKLAAAEMRRRWRALLLITKAKLELIAQGDSTIEREFMADTMLPNGQTVGEAMLPKIAQAYQTGEMPRLQLGSGK